MRAKTIAALLLAVATVAVLLPAAADARPGFYKVPRFTVTQAAMRGTHGYTIYLLVAHGRVVVSASRSDGESDSTVVYQRRLRDRHGDDLSVDLGRAGHFDARFVRRGTEEFDLGKPCKGGPTIVETGAFVGTLDFHGRGGFTSFHRQRLSATVTREPARVCPGKSPSAPGAGNPGNRIGERERRLVAGDASGDRRFTATTYPALVDGHADTTFSAEVRRREGGLLIADIAQASQASTAFAVPDLDELPTTTTVEPPAPFSGSATFSLPSPQTAELSGDLRVVLPEIGEVRLTDPGTDAGVCRGYSCTKSLPKALRPSRSSRNSFTVVTVTISESPPKSTS